MNEKQSRLNQLLAKTDLTDDEVNEAYRITEELDLNNEEPETELDFETVKNLGITLQNLKTERKALELQEEIRRERKKITELKERLEKKKVWCEECQEYVID